MLFKFASEYAIRKVWENHVGMKLNGTYQFLAYVDGVNLLGEHKQNKLHGLSPRANYTDRATAASRRSGRKLLRKKGATWSA
jgi:hypothetical protein